MLGGAHIQRELRAMQSLCDPELGMLNLFDDAEKNIPFRTMYVDEMNMKDIPWWVIQPDSAELVHLEAGLV